MHAIEARTKHAETPIKVWHRTGNQKMTCNLGERHTVNVYAMKILGPVVGGRTHNNGYESRVTDLRRDAQGRTYHQHVTIDFSNNVFWVRDDDGKSFTPRTPRGIDLNGNLIPR